MATVEGKDVPKATTNLKAGSLQICLPTPLPLPVEDVTLGQTENYHQGDRRFPEESRGRQCTPIAYTALVIASEIHPNVWSSETIDNILLMGDELYRNIPHEHTYVDSTELPSRVAINCLNRAQFNVRPGLLLSGNTLEGTGALTRDLVTACTNTTGCLLVTGGYTLAVIQPSDFEPYYVFDSHSRGEDGRLKDGGKARLWLCKTPHALATHIQNMFSGIQHSLDKQYDVVPLPVFKSSTDKVVDYTVMHEIKDLSGSNEEHGAKQEQGSAYTLSQGNSSMGTFDTSRCKSHEKLDVSLRA